jgi:hypothetical protein
MLHVRSETFSIKPARSALEPPGNIARKTTRNSTLPLTKINVRSKKFLLSVTIRSTYDLSPSIAAVERRAPPSAFFGDT